MQIFDLKKQQSTEPNQQVVSLDKRNQNIQSITLHLHQKYFEFQLNFKSCLVNEHLVIDKTNQRVVDKIKLDQPPLQTVYFSAFLGIINIMDRTFLLMAEDVEQVCTIEEHDIFKIASVQFIPFQVVKDDKSQEEQNKIQQILEYMTNIRKLLEIGFYFSYSYDLSLSKIKRAYGSGPNEKFIWNRHMFKNLLDQKVNPLWRVSLICGFIGYFSIFIMGKKIQFYLISRKSNKKAGTRYNSRGIDDDGNVANFCETEQIVVYNNYCCSHLQIRGSVPTFWGQSGITAKSKITRGFDMSQTAFKKHFEKVSKDYNVCLCVNLMAKSKKGEQLITDEFEKLVKTSNLNTTRYEYFDFHHACANQQFDQVNPLCRKLQPMLENFRYYIEDLQTNTVLMTQKGIIRTNCLDCLDRTNFFQTKMSALIFEYQMAQMGIDTKQIFYGQDIVQQLDSNNQKQIHPFIVNFKNMWADNGDIISKHYTGTGSTHTNITRTGKRDFFGLIDHGMKSLSRFYIQNFEDNTKQNIIDILLGESTENQNEQEMIIEKELKLHEREFSVYDNVSVFVGTWNMNDFEPPLSFDLNGSFFNFDNNKNPDLIVVGLQQAINKNDIDTTADNWNAIILDNLNKLENTYISVKYKGFQDMIHLCYAKNKMQGRISKVSNDSIKLSMIGQSTRGAQFLKLWIDDTSFCFLNVCLEPGVGQKFQNMRCQNIEDIHNKGFQTEGVGKRKEEKIQIIDYKIMSGDMNIQINLLDTEIENKLKAYESCEQLNKLQDCQEILTNLLSFDELSKMKQNSEILKKYQEDSIDFLPTGLYGEFSTVYKQHSCPGWFDRIMIWPNENEIIKQQFYNRRDYIDSDHRPVVTYYILEVKKIIEEQRQEVIKRIYSNVQQEFNEYYDEEMESKIKLVSSK